MAAALGPKDFHLGLAMSGAISAGAYTAGVFDYLIQVLDEWEAATGAAGAEACHSVGLKVLTGASAGAITAAVGALALADGERGLRVFTDAKGKRFPYYLPKLYEGWVVLPALVDESGGGNDLLSVSDLQTEPDPLLNQFLTSSDAKLPPAQGANPVLSLLNTRVLATIANAAITPPQTLGARSYVADPLNIYMTLTNLRGIPYRVAFGPEDEGNYYYMTSHADRVHYEISGLGGWNAPDSICGFGVKGAPGVKLDARSFVAPASAAWRDFSVCALASGAFPVGLAPRVISADAQIRYDKRLFPINDLITYGQDITLNWPAAVSANPKGYYFTTADGGTINNDPFEYAIFALKDADKLDRPLNDKYRSVIMISPFPEEKPIRSANDPRLDMVSIVTALFPSLIDQARFKPEALVLAAEDSERGAFLVSPSRVLTGEKKPQRYGIASGLLGGFGGFVSRAFRDHDFQLGRRNCQWFLERSFTLPGDDPLFKAWSHAPANAASAAAGGTDLRIIPICGSALPPVESPDWPRLPQASFETLQTRIAQRFDTLGPALVRQSVAGALQGILRILLSPPLSRLPLLPRDKVLNFIRQTVLADLVRRDQIEGWELPGGLGVTDDQARLILAELVEPAYDLRSAEGICVSIAPALRPEDDGLDAARIEAALDKLKGAGGSAKVWEAPLRRFGMRRLFALDQRKPGAISDFLGGVANLDWFKPSVDPEGKLS
jgi:hypothetical protein